MSFWDLSDGANAADEKSTEYEIPSGGNLDPIPDGSSVLAMIDEAKWDQKKIIRINSFHHILNQTFKCFVI